MKIFGLSLIVFSIMVMTLVFANGQQPNNQYYEQNVQWEYARLITLESIIAGGIGRSRIFTVTPGGEQYEDKLENYYSLGGINFKNVYFNEQRKTEVLNKLSNEGWELYWIETGNQDGIYTTKYMLRRKK